MAEEEYLEVRLATHQVMQLQSPRPDADSHLTTPTASTVGSSVMEMATNMNLHSTEKNPIRNRTNGADLEGRIITAGTITKAKTGRPKPRAITRASRGDAVVFGKVSSKFFSPRISTSSDK